MDSVEFVEKHIILLLGSIDKPVPSTIHLQKEMFILSNVKPDIKKHFDFVKHYKGPFSPMINDLIENSVYTENAFSIVNDKILLASNGKQEFNKMVMEYSQDHDDNFNNLMLTLKFIREIYDRLSKNELLFLIYNTYPDFTQYLDVSDKLLQNPALKKYLLQSIMSKGLISEERYLELLGGKKNE